MKSNIYYHGSPKLDLTYLMVNTYITPYMYLAIAFGRYHLNTYKTWSDSDLVKPYDFVEGPIFKEDCVPLGTPTIYKIVANDCDIDFLSNPFEHVIKIDIEVEKLRLFNICSL